MDVSVPYTQIITPTEQNGKSHLLIFSLTSLPLTSKENERGKHMPQNITSLTSQHEPRQENNTLFCSGWQY